MKILTKAEVLERANYYVYSNYASQGEAAKDIGHQRPWLNRMLLGKAPFSDKLLKKIGVTRAYVGI